MYNKKYYTKYRESVIKYLGGVCVVCGTTENLEFDHIDPTTKLYNVSDVWEYPIDKHKQELDKCQLLCHEHHIEKHITKDHGTETLYKHGCRCNLCKAYHNAYRVERRKRLKMLG